MKQKLKSNKGITLITLIVTIIVLLILGTVTIKLIVDNGIVGRSKNATKKYTIAEEKELIQLAYADYKMGKAENGDATFEVADAKTVGNEYSGWTITFYGTGNRYAFDLSKGIVELTKLTEEEKLLERYLLGENGETIALEDILQIPAGSNPEIKFLNNKVMPDANEKLEYIIFDDEIGEVIFRYENKLYKLVVNVGTLKNETVKLISTETEEEKLLEKYFLGENGETKTLMDLISNITEVNSPVDAKFVDNEIIPDASTKIMCTNEGKLGYGCVEIFVKYENKIYSLICNVNSENKAIIFRTGINGTEGQTVKYSYDAKKENEKDWTVLYDYGDTVEIISPDAIGSLTLGYNDEEAQNPGDIDKNGEANTNLDKAIYSYNNAISRIDKYTKSLVTNPNKISVRSLGSNPNNPLSENSTMYKSESLSEVENGRYNGIGKGTDNNWVQDLTKMNYLGININTPCWLPSRMVADGTYGSFPSIIYFIRDIFNPGSYARVSETTFVQIGYSGYVWDEGTYTRSVRPVVKVNKADLGL